MKRKLAAIAAVVLFTLYAPYELTRFIMSYYGCVTFFQGKFRAELAGMWAAYLVAVGIVIWRIK